MAHGVSSHVADCSKCTLVPVLQHSLIKTVWGNGRKEFLTSGPYGCEQLVTAPTDLPLPGERSYCVRYIGDRGGRSAGMDAVCKTELVPLPGIMIQFMELSRFCSRWYRLFFLCRTFPRRRRSSDGLIPHSKINIRYLRAESSRTISESKEARKLNPCTQRRVSVAASFPDTKIYCDMTDESRSRRSRKDPLLGNGTVNTFPR
jgi:hypothetical protein